VAAGGTRSSSPPRSNGKDGRLISNQSGLSARHIVTACEESLRRLKTDANRHLYQMMHHVSRTTPWEEIWQAMETAGGAGHRCATSGRPTSRLAPRRRPGVGPAPALPRARLRAVHLTTSSRDTWSWRSSRRLRRTGIGIIPWSPLHGGLLSGGAAQAGRRQAAPAPRPGGAADSLEKMHRPALEAHEKLSPRWERGAVQRGAGVAAVPARRDRADRGAAPPWSSSTARLRAGRAHPVRGNLASLE
jgi:aryl-alcohol dehydrogenase-like predicted oxidoreductase